MCDSPACTVVIIFQIKGNARHFYTVHGEFAICSLKVERTERITIEKSEMDYYYIYVCRFDKID